MLREECKKEKTADKTVLAASFDLQQVIYLPVFQENALFYKLQPNVLMTLEQKNVIASRGPEHRVRVEYQRFPLQIIMLFVSIMKAG